jgi:outer membrane protein
MKNLATVLSVLALAGTAVLFFLYGKHDGQSMKMPAVSEKQSVPASSFRIAYFELDSLKAHYSYFKDAESHAKDKESAMNMELSSLQNKYQKKIAEWQKKGASMTQTESQQAQQEYGEMQQTYQSRKEALQEEFAKNNGQVMTDKNYSFIFEYEPNSLIYYKDTTYNITADVIDGLNAAYKKKN